MRHKANTRSSLFLMELIIAILFFSLASAICLRMFAKSQQLSTEASALNQAVNQTSSVAELIRYDIIHGSHSLATEYPDADVTEDFGNSTIYFNRNWNSCTKEHAEYKLIIQEQPASATLKKYTLDMYNTARTISETDSGAVIYELPLSIHVAREVNAHE